MAAPAGLEPHPTPGRYVGVVTGLLRRPMASYYALLASAGLLLGLGLIMVLSASSIDSYANSGSAFTVFTKQLTFALIGIPAFWLALRLPMRVWPMLGWPLVVLATVLLLALPFFGKEVNGAKLWLDLGVVQIQPVEIAKLALALWGAAVLVRKRPLLTEWRHLAVPLLTAYDVEPGWIARWAPRLVEAQIANARMNDMAGLWAHPQLKARARWREVGSPAGAIPALLPPGRNSSFDYRMDAVPAVGQHTEAILRELGQDAAQIAALRATRAI